MENHFAEHEGAYKARVMFNTWGHTNPKLNTEYNGFVIFAIGVFGDLVIIDYNFDGVDSGPVIYNDLQSHFFEVDRDVGVYRFEGLYKIYKKENKNDRFGYFKGRTKKICTK